MVQRILEIMTVNTYAAYHPLALKIKNNEKLCTNA